MKWNRRGPRQHLTVSAHPPVQPANESEAARGWRESCWVLARAARSGVIESNRVDGKTMAASAAPDRISKPSRAACNSVKTSRSMEADLMGVRAGSQFVGECDVM